MGELDEVVVEAPPVKLGRVRSAFILAFGLSAEGLDCPLHPVRITSSRLTATMPFRLLLTENMDYIPVGHRYL
ncbi:hypothetical protein CWRG_02082 [Chthonomonas calidirosea]|nr:hypothetical protein CWRG_02082 [Chthonomonas calidirosea]